MNIENSVGEILKQSRSLLDENSYGEALRYLENGEYEMAYEGLLIELVKNNRYPEGFDFGIWKVVGEACDLDTNGGVFDYEIWSKFLKWGERG